MKRIIISALMVAFCLAAAEASDYSDRIAARIDDAIILVSEVREGVMTGGEADETVLREYLESMVKNKVIYLEALENEEIIVSNDEIEQRLDAMIERMKSNFGTTENYLAALKKEGIDENTLRALYRQQIKEELYVQTYVSSIIRPGISVEEDELEEFYTDKKDKFVRPSKYTYEIVFKKMPLTEKDTERAVRELKDLRKDILAKKMTFAEAAEKYSDGPSASAGGRLGEVKRGTMVKEFEDKVFGMKAGEISEPFMTKYGYHIAFVEKINENGPEVSHIIIIPSPAPQVVEEYRKNIEGLFNEKGMDGIRTWGEKEGITFIPFESKEENQINHGILSMINGLTDDSISEVRYLNNGLTFIYLKEKTEPEQMEFDDVRSYVKNMIMSMKINKEVDSLYERLKKKYYIEILL